MDISGSPCTDYSPVGSQHGIQGKTGKLLFGWLALMKTLGVSILVHENVKNFNIQHTLDILGEEDWSVVSLKFQPADAGYAGVSRPRRYDILYKKTVFALVADPHAILKRITRTLSQHQVPPSEFFIDTTEGLRAEMLRSTQRECLASLEATLDGGPPLEHLLDKYTDNWSAFLSDWELKNLEAYIARFPDGSFFALGQSASKWPTTQTSSGAMPCFRRNGTDKIWSVKHCRWATPREKCAAMGWPINEDGLQWFAICNMSTTFSKHMSHCADSLPPT